MSASAPTTSPIVRRKSRLSSKSARARLVSLQSSTLYAVVDTRPMMRVEGQIAINAILRRLPNLGMLTDTPQWRPTITLRGLKALPVSFARGSKPEPAAEAAVAEPLASR